MSVHMCFKWRDTSICGMTHPPLLLRKLTGETGRKKEREIQTVSFLWHRQPPHELTNNLQVTLLWGFNRRWFKHSFFPELFAFACSVENFSLNRLEETSWVWREKGCSLKQENFFSRLCWSFSASSIPWKKTSFNSYNKAIFPCFMRE